MRSKWWWSLTLCALCACACASMPGGVQAKFAYKEGHALRVVDVPQNGSAYQAGLRVGDNVIQIDKAWVSDLTLKEAVDKLRGPLGSKVKLKVHREKETLTFDVERAEYNYRRP